VSCAVVAAASLPGKKESPPLLRRVIRADGPEPQGRASRASHPPVRRKRSRERLIFDALQRGLLTASKLHAAWRLIPKGLWCHKYAMYEAETTPRPDRVLLRPHHARES